jgi:hypothetical protein
MASQRTISGAQIKIYINGIVYDEAQQLDYTIDYGEEPIYGIDSFFPQEIKITRISVQGTISGLRVKDSNGLQGYSIRPGVRDSVFAPYISIRIADRETGEDILFIPNAKVTNERSSVSAKGVMKTTFSFTGLQPQQPLDRK